MCVLLLLYCRSHTLLSFFVRTTHALSPFAPRLFSLLGLTLQVLLVFAFRLLSLLLLFAKLGYECFAITLEHLTFFKC